MSEQELTQKDNAFDDFIDSDTYENLNTAIWELVKAAYNEAWEKGQKAILNNTEK